MRAVEVPAPGAPMRVVRREPPRPGAGEVRIKVEACGVCHSDMFATMGGATNYPVVPGHEVVGVVDELGPGVTGVREGARVGLGWFGGSCRRCASCRAGDFITCDNLRTPGMTYDGGYAEMLVAPAEALVEVPDGLSAVQAAPLLCAGVTTYNALRRSPARSGDLVAVLGLGGLGHLAVQFAAKMGFETVAVSRGSEKGELATELGAHHVVDSEAEDVGKALSTLGGARVVLATATSSPAIGAALPGLAKRGTLIVLGGSMEPIEVPVGVLIGTAATIVGHPSGTAADSADALRFSALAGIRPMVETRPLAAAQEAYDRMMSNQARFRMVLTP